MAKIGKIVGGTAKVALAGTMICLLAALCMLCTVALAESGEPWLDWTFDQRIDRTKELLHIDTDFDKYDPTYLSLLGLEHIIPWESCVDSQGNQNIIYMGIDDEMLHQYTAYLRLFGYRVADDNVQAGVHCIRFVQPDPEDDGLLVPPEICLYQLEEPHCFVIRYDLGYETLDRALRARVFASAPLTGSGLVCEQAIVADECLLYTDGIFTLPEPYPSSWEEDLHILRDGFGSKATITTEDWLKLLILKLRTLDGSTPDWANMTLCLVEYMDSDNDVADGGRTVDFPLAFASGMTVTDGIVTLDAQSKDNTDAVYVLIPFPYDQDESYRLFVSPGSGTLFEWPALEIGPMTFLE